MKANHPTTPVLLAAVLSLTAPNSFSQTQTAAPISTNSPASSADYVCIQRGPHSKVWQRAIIQTNSDDTVSTNFQSYTELASGLCYLDSGSGQYIDSVEQIDLTATGAQAIHGAHQVLWAANVNTAGGALHLTTPDSQTFNSRVFGLAYWDSVAGTNVMIGQLQDSTGTVIGSNQVLYSDAFSGSKADLLYTYTKAGLEQNVVLREQLPSPVNYGLNPESTRLQVLTEFFSPAAPLSVYSVQTNASADDSIISFGTMYIGIGRAFLTGVGSDFTDAGPVTKHWTVLDGRTFLIEEIPFSAMSSLETNLPLHASLSKPSQRISRTAALRTPPKAKTTPASAGMKVAKFDDKKPGFLIDYSMVSTGTNLTFQSDTTYYVSGSVSIYGTNTFEGGTIIKFAPGVGITTVPVPATLQLNFATGPYRPVVFTAQDDDSVGDSISGSTSNPWTNHYANTALSVISCSPTITQVRFCFAQQALSFTGATPLVRDTQFVNCSNGVTGGGMSLTLENALFANVFAPFNNLSAGNSVIAENVSFSSNQFLLTIGNTNYISTSLPMSYTNCIFNEVTNFAGYPASSPSPYTFYTPVGDYNGFYGTSSFGSDPDPGSYPFQPAGAGGYYMTNSSYLNAGTTTIDPALLSDLQNLTTYPPVSISGSITVNTNLSPQVPRDNTGHPSLGFHYSPLDYAVNASMTNVTVLPGTALGAFGSTNGIFLNTNAIFNCTGTATSPNYIVRYNTVQEQSTTNWETTSWQSSFAASAVTDLSAANFTFTQWSVLAGTNQHIYSQGVPCPLSFQNCQFYGGAIWDISGNFASMNSLYRRVEITVKDPANTPSDSFFNNLFLDGSLSFKHKNSGIWTFRDNLFDSTDITNLSASTIDACSNNAYVTTNYGILGFDPIPVILTNSPAYQTTTFGAYYYPSNQTNLIHEGSELASAAGLYHYTVTTNNVIEGTNTVSIGFHYVAVDANGQPLDTTGDGLPDYVKDSNGDGVYDAGDLANWLNPNNIYDQGATYGGYTPANVRLGYWTFTNGFSNQAGSAPYQPWGVTLPSWSGESLFMSPTNHMAYYVVETNNNWTNFNCANGTVRFWFKPHWTSKSLGGNGPQTDACFLNVGKSGGDLWTWHLTSDGNVMGFACFSNGIDAPYSGESSVPGPHAWSCSFSSSLWYQLALTYSPSNIAVYTNGVLAGTATDFPYFSTNGQQMFYKTGNGMFVWPAATNNLISIGCDLIYESQLNGEIDDFETFNYPLSAQAIAYGFTTFPGETTTNIMQDSDYVGRSDLLRTLVDGVTSLPDPSAVVACRLGYWRFNSSGLVSEEGQFPTYVSGVTTTSSLIGGVLSIGSSVSSAVTYPDVGSNGWANINCKEGTVRFWYKRNGGSGGPLIYLGNSTNSEWAINAGSGNSSVTFVTETNGIVDSIVTASCDLNTNQWNQIVLAYGPGGSTFYINGTNTGGPGVTNWLSATDRKLGMVIGNNTAYNSAVNGQFAELETFNYELSSGEILSNYQAVANIDSDRNGTPDIIEDTVLSGSTPFLGQPVSIAGVIEAEQFDRGGPGIAYSNVATHGTNWYRNTGMCITNCDDLGWGYCLDQTQSNEWTCYTINVLVSGTYAIETRVEGLGVDGVFKLTFATNGPPYTNTDPLTIPGTNWSNVTGYATLVAGTNVMTLQCLTNGRLKDGSWGGFVGRFNYMTVYPWWQAGFTSTYTNTVTNLIPNSNTWAAATNNAIRIQAALNDVESMGGGTVLITNVGSNYVAQLNPDETQDAWANAVVNITNNNIELRGGGTNTTLIGFNRATTVLFLGADTHNFKYQCANFLLRDITLQAQPHMAVNPSDPTGTVYEAGQLAPASGTFSQGSLAAFSGPDTNHYTYNILLTNCEFLNADTSITIPQVVSNVLLQDCTFITWQGANGYVPGQTSSPPAANTQAYYGGVGFYARGGTPIYNIGVVNCSFDGNPNATNYITNQEGAANGFIIFEGGGSWFALRNRITNNAEEAIQVQAGPCAIAGNIFYSWANNPACCALNAFALTGALGLTGHPPVNFFTSFVGNSNWGNQYGEWGIEEAGFNVPYTVNFSGNYLDLFSNYPNPSVLDGNAGGAFASSNCQPAFICGNTIVTAGHGVNVQGASTNLVILANSFLSVEHNSILDQGVGPQTLQEGQVIRNILARGDNYHIKVPYSEGFNWFFYQNQYFDAFSSAVPPFTDAASLPVHISY
jgi:hypothetical protein